jgi:hypothetical protein
VRLDKLFAPTAEQVFQQINEKNDVLVVEARRRAVPREPARRHR